MEFCCVESLGFDRPFSPYKPVTVARRRSTNEAATELDVALLSHLGASSFTQGSVTDRLHRVLSAICNSTVALHPTDTQR